MLIEAESIPYDAARLLGERLLVLAPHPDDEVIGCGGLVAQHLREGRAVRVVVATDGAEAGGAARREEESRRALALLGGDDIHFLRFADRALDETVAPVLRDHLAAFKPDLICVPSPIEIHPDHLALSRAFCDLVQGDESLFADLAIARVAFYEVSQPLRPNTLVDITDVAEIKYQAIAAHESQTAIRDYAGYARGLNAYRASTLPPATKFAEAYWTTPLPILRTTPFSALRRSIAEAPAIETTRATLPITVIIRTKDRPALLREAVHSVRANEHPAEIVVVNDGGARPDIDVKVVQHDKSRGRSEAMNSGVRAATTKYIAFLDDDDLYYPEHLSTLAAAAQSATSSAAWYSDAVSSFLAVGDRGQYESRSRLRLFANDFDRELLLIDNYIPLPTLLTTREAFLDAGGFDPQFDLFEDWDFLIRLSQRGDFTHVPRVTCEIRSFEGGGSILLAAPEGSARFRDAKLQVWRKHASRISNETFANVFERQKRRAAALESTAVDAKGRRAQSENAVARLEREKNQLIAEIQTLHNAINERTIYIKELEGVIQVLTGESDRATAESERLRKSLDDAQAMGRATYAEIERLQGLLNMIYKSRTWKLHAMVERMKGRG
ncbi:MAG TPA: PIG-L family deacetylase [Thermoanaerobaculia bacterium]|jgi:LmbE family N-acetylglucosaminyl deacetylase|nr:PIG-L family deacetylase [Thermoanaerobaculia bacterium]